MQVILTENVDKLGAVGDVCNVAPGYGRNFLLPRRMAILATQGALRQIGDLKRSENRRQDKIRGEMQSFAKKIGALKLPFVAKVGETGRLYGAITAANIAEALEAALGESIDRRKINLDEPIKTLGEHVVTLHLMPGVDANIHVDVSAEEGAHPQPHRAEARGEDGADVVGEGNVAGDVAAEAVAAHDSDDPSESEGADQAEPSHPSSADNED